MKAPDSLGEEKKKKKEHGQVIPDLRTPNKEPASIGQTQASH